MIHIKKILLIIFVGVANQAISQDYTAHNISIVPENARFEIVQSDHGARYTFKIDKYTGEVYQLTELEGALVWSTLGLGPAIDLMLNAVLEANEDFTPDQIANRPNKTIDNSELLTNEQFEQNGKNEDDVSYISPDQVNFQIFLSGLGARFTFLIHIHTGTTWQLVRDPETEDFFWSIIE